MNAILNYKKTIMGFAAIWVLLLHYLDELYIEIHLPVVTRIFSIGYVGVEIFLFLSGAGLYYSLCHNSDIKSFYKKRIVRTVIPWLLISFPYWLLNTIIADHDSIGVFLLNFTGISFWTNNIHTVWYCAFITALYAVYPIVFCVQRKKFSIWPVMAAVLIINFALFFLNPLYYGTIEEALTRIPIFLLGSYYAERIMNHKSIKFFYWYSAIGFILFIISFFIQLEPDVEILFRRYFAGGFVIAVLCILVYLFGKTSTTFPLLDFFGGISLEVYLISVLLRNIITRLCIGENTGIPGKWIIVGASCAIIITLSKAFSVLYFEAVNVVKRKMLK